MRYKKGLEHSFMNTSSVKVTALMIVFNEERFLDICLTKIIDCVDQIVIVEGAVEYFWPNSNDGASTDKTVEIIKEWANHYDNRISIVQGRWKNKHDMQKAGFLKVSNDTDYLFIVDADEMYDRMELEFIFNMAERDKPDVIKYKMRHWGIGGGFHEKGIFGHPISRVFRWENDLLPKENNINIFNSNIKPYRQDKVLILDGYKCDHYGHIDPKRSELKKGFYAHRSSEWKAGLSHG